MAKVTTAESDIERARRLETNSFANSAAKGKGARAKRLGPVASASGNAAPGGKAKL